MKDPKHPLSVRSTDEGGFYSEYDKHDRVTYHKDKWGYHVLLFYHDDPHLRVPYYVVHKHYKEYNPN